MNELYEYEVHYRDITPDGSTSGSTRLQSDGDHRLARKRAQRLLSRMQASGRFKGTLVLESCRRTRRID